MMPRLFLCAYWRNSAGSAAPSAISTITLEEPRGVLLRRRSTSRSSLRGFAAKLGRPAGAFATGRSIFDCIVSGRRFEAVLRTPALCAETDAASPSLYEDDERAALSCSRR